MHPRCRLWLVGLGCWLWLAGSTWSGHAAPHKASVQFAQRQILIDGKPRIVMAGEIHYFRLPRSAWPDRIQKLKAAGCTAVSSYVPWIVHEPVEGKVQLDDLAAFIDLCRKNGLWFFARPGPFNMAELKNEGIPGWVFKKHPDIVPTGWDGQAPPVKAAVDYLAPGFLKEAHKWVSSVMRVVTPRLRENGGNVIGLQLDNEIGMLSWVTNSPPLSDRVLANYARWLGRQYDARTLRQRYPFDLADARARAAAIRSPKDSYAPQLLADLGHYLRHRTTLYVGLMRRWMRQSGARTTPLLVNIHGSGGGRALSFPIGISQLYESYTKTRGVHYGSDMYLGNLTLDNVQLHGSRETCGFETRVGKGKAVVIATDYPCDLSFFRTALQRLGARAGLEHGCAEHGIVMTSTVNPEGERFLHLINLDGFAKTLHLAENGKPLFGKQALTLQPRDGVMLPLGVTLGDVTVRRSTAEITGVTQSSLELRLTQDRDVIELQTARELLPGRDYTVQRRGDTTIVSSRKQARTDDRLVLRFR